MARNAKNRDSAIGFRVKSGWATAVLVAGSIQSPEVLDRRRIELSDPALPETRQPYHAAMGQLETDEAKVAKRRKVVASTAHRSFTELLGQHHDAGHRPCAAGLVVGSEIDPARVANPHIRAHALEGQLFRTVLEEAAQSYGLPCSVFVERNIYLQATQRLEWSEDDLKGWLAKLGRALGGPWRADEKMACLAGWLVLDGSAERRA
jgi:hypothetical protein